jgi:aspartate kinase
MENSAVSFSIVIDNTIKADKLIYLLENDFKVRYNTDLQLITIRYYNKNIIKELLQNKKVLVEQKTRSTARYTVKN